jgi:sugar lactone lactonase YvrE
MGAGLRAPATALLALLACAAPAIAETQLQAYTRLRAAAAAASKAGDHALAEQRLNDARAIFPNHPGALVMLARAQAAQGHAGEAAATLDRLAREGLAYDVAADPALKAVAEAPAMAPVLARLKANGGPVGRLARSLQLAGGGRPVEGVAYDAASRRLIFSTVGGGRLMALEADGRARPFGAFQAQGGLFGLAVDAQRGALWATEASGPKLPAGGPPATALVRLDLKTGALVERYGLAGDHLLGDLTLGPDGTVYASDGSDGGGVYRLKPGAKTLEALVAPGELGSPQGLAVVDGGRALIVADYASGLHRIDPATGAMARLAEPEAVTLTGIDGVVRDGAGLIVTQNGNAPQRILRVRLADHGRRIAGVEVLLANPGLPGEAPDVALGAVAGREFVFVARSGWAKADGEGRLTPEAAAAPALIGWIPLGS